MTQPLTDRPPGAPGHFSLEFPQSWWHLDLDPRTRDNAIRRRIEEQTQGQDYVSADDVDAMVRTTRSVAREAYGQGALRAAGMFRFLDDGSTLMAATVVLRVRAPEDGSADMAELLMPVALKNARNPLGRGTPANSVEMIELPEAGPAGRVTAIEDVDYFGRGHVRTALMHTIAAVPNSRDFLVISSTTPNLSLVTEFFEVFDAISSTLRFED
ncbi:hypothetical protein [Streptomyces sp. NPDC091371]|uniref:hypothetical protein n=1 Tax=Streptomyces sp. NPDC091371 TaxID=3155303 RepID=UPI003412B27D